MKSYAFVCIYFMLQYAILKKIKHEIQEKINQNFYVLVFHIIAPDY